MMKHWRGACVAVALLGLAGCITIPSIPGLPSIPGATITNAPPATVSGQIATGAFARPAIAVGHDGALYVAAEGAKMGSINLWVNAGKGWQGGEVVRASKATAGRCYVPRLVVDAEGWCWLSFRWGNKEFGTLHGPGVWIRAPAGAGTLFYPQITTGAARLAQEGEKTILLSKNGAWGEIDRKGNVVRRGTFNAGATGEKFDFVIAGTTWATCHNGYSAQASAVSVAGKRKTWADYATYPDQSDDLNYPSICAVPGNVYCQASYGGRTRVQVLDATGTPRYSPTNLPSLGTATTEQRCPPRLFATSNGVEAIWRAGKDIVRVKVEASLKGEQAARIATGEFPDVAVGHDGRIHLVYVAGGSLQYKELR